MDERAKQELKKAALDEKKRRQQEIDLHFEKMADLDAQVSSKGRVECIVFVFMKIRHFAAASDDSAAMNVLFFNFLTLYRLHAPTCCEETHLGWIGMRLYILHCFLSNSTYHNMCLVG